MNTETCTHCKQPHLVLHTYTTNSEQRRICPPCVDSSAQIVARHIDVDRTPASECGYLTN